MSGRIRNPVIGGFHPDPSVCVVGDDIYLAASSFAWFPGVPIWHSRDLAHWRLLGNALDRPRQLPLARAGLNGGIWAPTLRYRDGRFFLVTTNMEGGGHLIVHATDPAGPWSDPLPVPIAGWDPSLDWDADGTCFFTCSQDGAAIVGCTIDPLTATPTSAVRRLWADAAVPGIEAPHLIHHDGWYVLLVAGGFYLRNHHVAAARARSPWGPYEACPWNPILSQRDRLAHPIQCAGHADAFRLRDGSWWLCHLAVRNWGGMGNAHHPLGRESFLTRLEWRDGWPAAVPVEPDMPAVLPPAPWPADPGRDDFAGGRLGPRWISLRASAGAACAPGSLAVRGPGVVAQRVPQPWMRAAARVRGTGGSVTLFTAEQARLDLEVHGGRVALRRTFDDWSQIVAAADTAAAWHEVEIRGNPWAFAFSVRSDGVEVLSHKVQSRLLSTDLAGGCVGLVAGLASPGPEADIEAAWFELAGWRDEPAGWRAF